MQSTTEESERDSLHWTARAKQFLALSAGVSFTVLEERNEHGDLRYARGRQKYYGLGALVIFFALFSGYGMGHMLSTMGNMPLWLAVVAGAVWAIFQWCLERQMLISIAQDAKWFVKFFGFAWRSLLASLSALTLVYPFFVESNRAEIDVKISEIVHTRLASGQAASSDAVGLPLLLQDGTKLEHEQARVNTELRSDPPELAAFRASAKQCWQRYGVKDREFRSTTAAILLNAKDELAANAQISQLREKLAKVKGSCEAADANINAKILAWKNKKQAEKTELENRQALLLNKTDEAKNRSQEIAANYATKVERAAHSGFAADFLAVTELLKNDFTRQLQFVWFLIWFLAIELVAIIIKFTSKTDVDYRINADEQWTNANTLEQQEQRLSDLALQTKQTENQRKGQMAALVEDDGKTWQALSATALRSEALKQNALRLSELELAVPATLLAQTLQQILEAEQQKERFMHQAKNSKHHERAEQLLAESLQHISETFQKQLAAH